MSKQPNSNKAQKRLRAHMQKRKREIELLREQEKDELHYPRLIVNYPSMLLWIKKEGLGYTPAHGKEERRLY